MLANNKATALKYTKDPILICKSDKPSQQLFYVPDAALPALSIDNCDPMSLVSPEELFYLKKKYRAPQSLIKKIQKCYAENSDEIDIGDDISLEKKLFCKSLEDIILNKIKRTYRNESANFIPHYAREETGIKCFHTQVVGSSSVGKSWTTAECVKRNFKGASAIYVFSPTATKDKAWKDLKGTPGFAKKVKLINSNEVNTPIPLGELLGGSVLIIDDPDAVRQPAKQYITELQSEALFHGRHHTDTDGVGMTVFSICHDAWAVADKGLKSSNIESSRVICFPNLNRSIVTKYLSKRLHWSSKEIKEAYKFIRRNDRWMCIYSHCPNLLMTKHGCMLL